MGQTHQAYTLGDGVVPRKIAGSASAAASWWALLISIVLRSSLFRGEFVLKLPRLSARIEVSLENGFSELQN